MIHVKNQIFIISYAEFKKKIIEKYFHSIIIIIFPITTHTHTHSFTMVLMMIMNKIIQHIKGIIKIILCFVHKSTDFFISIYFKVYSRDKRHSNRRKHLL